MIILYGDLTREDSRMRVSLKGLPYKLRGAAWPSSARGVNCLVKSRNERDPHCYLPSFSPEKGHYSGTAVLNQRKEWSTAGQYTAEVEKKLANLYFN